MYSLAGSIRIILKPINQQTSFSTTYSDDFAQDLIQLFKAGYDKKSILDFSGLYDKNILKKYNDFVSFLNEESLAVGINGTMPTLRLHTNRISAPMIQKNIS